MSYSRLLPLAVAASVALVAVACDGPIPTQNLNPDIQSPGPLCQLGCVDTDPAPTAPGIFLGNRHYSRLLPQW
jgi:hypothetical protein